MAMGSFPLPPHHRSLMTSAHAAAVRRAYGTASAACVCPSGCCTAATVPVFAIMCLPIACRAACGVLPATPASRATACHWWREGGGCSRHGRGSRAPNATTSSPKESLYGAFLTIVFHAVRRKTRTPSRPSDAGGNARARQRRVGWRCWPPPPQGCRGVLSQYSFEAI